MRHLRAKQAEKIAINSWENQIGLIGLAEGESSWWKRPSGRVLHEHVECHGN
jgi:hypothetical protein